MENIVFSGALLRRRGSGSRGSVDGGGGECSNLSPLLYVDYIGMLTASCVFVFNVGLVDRKST